MSSKGKRKNKKALKNVVTDEESEEVFIVQAIIGHKFNKKENVYEYL